MKIHLPDGTVTDTMDTPVVLELSEEERLHIATMTKAQTLYFRGHEVSADPTQATIWMYRIKAGEVIWLDAPATVNLP
ncbi:MAG: hypothetical protein R3330_02930 [Saprospiraceae bacterium]|nr:hypothetical protein [Saprospiraceae bacterium]